MNRENSNQYFQLKKWVAILLVVLCIAISWMSVLDKKTGNYVDAAIVNATIAYGSARALNGAVSVAQSTQVGFCMGGEASIQPFEILDPINDMVEDFATVMKFSISSLLIQKLLVEILANSIFKWLILGLGALLIAGLFLNVSFLTPLFKVFIFVSLIRFMFVIAIFLSCWVDGAYLNEQTAEKVKLIEQTASDIAFISDTNSKNEKLTPDELVKVNQDIQDTKTKKIGLLKKIQNQEKITSSVKQKMQEAEKALENSGGIVERWNPLNKDKSIETAENTLDESRASYDRNNDLLNVLKGQLKDLDNQLSEYQDEIPGKNNILSKTKVLFKSAYTLLDLQKIKTALKGSIDTMFHLIAVFVLKTMLLPIAFLYLIIRIFKLVWGIDLRTFYKESHL